jgi:molecular chaperone IbpA
MEDVAMRTFDPTPLWRSTVGFDRLFDLIDSSLSLPGDDNYPPYNIERTGEDAYHISLTLAGFTPDEVTVTAEQNMLTVEGHKADKGDHQYLYQGISGRPFRRQFSLADISLTLAGFTPDEVTVTAEQNMLTVEGHSMQAR